MDIKFNSIKELYKRVLPALAHKKRKLSKQGVEVKEIDIFRELSKKWSEEENLSLSDVVSDIMSYKDCD